MLARHVAGTLVAVALALAAGCTDNDGVPETSGPLENATVEDLDAALRPAAAALLDGSALDTTRRIFGLSGGLDSTVWLDLRSNGDYILVGSAGDTAKPNVTAWVQTEQGLFCATSGFGSCGEGELSGDELWTLQDPRTIDSERRQSPLGFDLGAIAEGSPFSDADEAAAGEMDLTKQVLAGGATVWTWSGPWRNGNVTRSWTIDHDGVLFAASVQPDPAIAVAVPATEYEFTIVDDPDPITPPEVGMPLDLGMLGVPENVKQPDND